MFRMDIGCLDIFISWSHSTDPYINRESSFHEYFVSAMRVYIDIPILYLFSSLIIRAHVLGPSGLN